MSDSITMVDASARQVVKVMTLVEPGDVSGDGDVELTDALLALKFIGGSEPSEAMYEVADVNGDNKIGIEEVIYVLQEVADLR